MSYNINPLTEDELNSFNLIEDGVYDFEVLKSTRKVSRAGNSMAELQLNVWDKTGKTCAVFDYLVFSDVPLNIKKVKHFCDSTGLQNEYKKGQIPEELEKLSGKVHIGCQDEKPNPNGGFYPKKNTVIDYVMADKIETKHERVLPELPQHDFDDVIPF